MILSKNKFDTSQYIMQFSEHVHLHSQTFPDAFQSNQHTNPVKITAQRQT